MGRIVINETENKQTVILNDSPEGIEGGYFDSQMNWHEMGGGSAAVDPMLANTLIFGNLTDSGNTKVAYVSTTPNNARAHVALPVISTGYRVSVTDASKYKVLAYDITSLELTTVSAGGATHPGFKIPQTTGDWTDHIDTVSGNYYWIYFKKENGDFTSEELADPIGVIFNVE